MKCHGLFRTSTVACMVFACGMVAAQSWNQIWFDDFTVAGLPSVAKWGREYGAGGWGNNEWQNYTGRSENARVESTNGGNLIIEARRDWYQNIEYSSARLLSMASWTYGKFEIRAKLPWGRGTWPAIWMLPVSQVYGSKYWPDNGEIDIMEHVGYDPNRVTSAVHVNLYNGANGQTPGNNTVLADVFNTYNTYALEWRPHEVRTTVNGQVLFIWPREGGAWNRWPFNQPFAFRLNIAVGGNWGGAQGVDPSVFPTSMKIDHVRVFQMSSTPYTGEAIFLPGKVQAENFDNGGEGFGFHDFDTANNGGSTYRSSSVDIATGGTPDGTPYIGWIEQDEWWTYSVRISREAFGTLSFNVASPYSGKTFEVHLDDKILASNVAVPNTGSWSTFTNVNIQNVQLPPGYHKIRIMSNSNLWNLNSFSFARKFIKTPY